MKWTRSPSASSPPNLSRTWSKAGFRAKFSASNRRSARQPPTPSIGRSVCSYNGTNFWVTNQKGWLDELLTNFQMNSSTIFQIMSTSICNPSRVSGKSQQISRGHLRISAKLSWKSAKCCLNLEKVSNISANFENSKKSPYESSFVIVFISSLFGLLRFLILASTKQKCQGHVLRNFVEFWKCIKLVV